MQNLKTNVVFDNFLSSSHSIPHPNSPLCELELTTVRIVLVRNQKSKEKCSEDFHQQFLGLEPKYFEKRFHY